MPTHYTAIVTSDRYGAEHASLDPERELARQFPDIALDLRGDPARSEEDLVRLGQEADALLLSTRDAVPRKLLAAIPRVKVIARYGVGLDNVDLDAATDHAIVITHYPQYCTSEVADHALAMLLTFNRRVAELDADLREGAWSRHGPRTRQILRGPVPAMRSLTIGVVAMGRIGSAVVARLRPFGCRIVVCDPYIDEAVIRAAGAEAVTFDELLRMSDMITMHCPLTPETRGLFGTDAFSRMKPDVALVNTARGPIVDQAALVAFLARHPAARAGLDVFEHEPLPEESPLFQLPNLLLTPHSAYYSEHSTETVRRETFLSALAVLRGYLPPTVANPAVLAKVPLRPQG